MPCPALPIIENVLIRSIEVWEVVVPFREPVCSPEFHEPRWELDRVPKLIVRINADGKCGLGESNRGVALQKALTEAKRLVGGDAVLATTGGSAGHAFEIALLDLLARWADVPFWRMLGDKVRNRVLCHYWTAHRTPAEMAEKCLEGQRLGFEGIKIKTQWGEPDIERLRAMQDACGPDFAMTIDPNSRYHTLENTLEVVKQIDLEGLNVLTLEDPFDKSRLEEYRRLRGGAGVPISLHLNEPALIFQAAKAEAAEYINTGSASPSEFMKCAAVAEAAGLPYWHGSEIDLGIKDMSYVHCCAVAEGCTLPSDIIGAFARKDDLIEPGIRYESGYALVPEEPGLGVELDENALEKFVLSYTEVRP